MPLDKPEIPLAKKMEAVNTYLDTGQSLRKIAGEKGIPYQTLWFWVQQYKRGGPESLKKRRAGRRRIPKVIELKVMYLKEQNPSLTIRMAKHLLKRDGITVSHDSIWQIWKRYGLTKRPIHDPLSPFCLATPESDDVLTEVRKSVKKGNLEVAAQILNEAPCLPKDQIILEIPEKFLSPRRRLDRLSLEFGRIPFIEFRKKAKQLGRLLERKGYMHSSIIANFRELHTLAAMGKYKDVIPMLSLLAKKMKNIKNNTLWFELYTYQAFFYCKFLQMNKVLDYIKKCRRLVYLLASSRCQDQFGALLTSFGKYKEATSFFKMSLKHKKDQIDIGLLSLKIASFGHTMAGEYRNAKKMLTKGEIVKNLAGYGCHYHITRAYVAFGQGDLAQATNFFLESLKKASKQELNNLIYVTSAGMAAVSMALNKKAEAMVYLKKYIPLMKKYKLMREELVLEQLLGHEDPVPQELLCMPPFCLLDLLVHAHRTQKVGDYRKAFKFAQNKKLLGLFHRWILFFPNPVLYLLEKGKKTGLPRIFLKFPIFNQNRPVYHIKFLGNVVITKNQQYLRSNLNPQEKAFLIHLAVKAGAPGKSISVRELCQNFWARSNQPSNILLHLLASLKKKLLSPGHLLSVSSQYGEPRLINRGVYMTTDYDEFETLLTQVKSLERANEWQFAKRDYMRAFRLLRGEPFKKMYDNWSEQMRYAIVNKIENAAIHFIKQCLEQEDKRDAQRALKKVVGIIPYSQGLSNLAKESGLSV